MTAPQTDPAAVAAEYRHAANEARACSAIKRRHLSRRHDMTVLTTSYFERSSADDDARAAEYDRIASVLEAAAARIADLERERQWQSIENVPVDTMVLALPAQQQSPCIPEIVVAGEDASDLYIRDVRDLRSDPIWKEWDQYTHWASIPPLPEKEEGE